MAANGMEALFAAAAAEKAAKSSGGGGYFKYFTLKDGEKQLVRFVSNDVVPARVFNLRTKDSKFAEVVDTELETLENPRPSILKNYPDIFFKTSMKGEKYPMKPTLVGLGLVVKREEYSEVDPETKRRVMKTRDLVEKVKDANGVESERVVVYLVKANNSTFWENLSEIYIRNDGNITTRDIQVSRKGATTDTKYNFLPFDKDEWTEPGEAEAHYRELLGDDAFPDINKWIESKASESWYKKVVWPLVPELAAQLDGAEEAPEEAAEESSTESKAEDTSSSVSKVSELMKKQREARGGK